MPINTGNQLEIAYKRLFGVATTNPIFGIGNEEIASSVQLGSYQIFGQQIVASPDDAVASGVAAKTIFRISPVPSSLIEGINYVWKLQKYDGTQWSDFSGQLIPFTFGQDYYPLLYKSGASSLVNSEEFGNININIGNQEDKNSAKNWFVDTFAGTLWFQDNTGDQITDEWFIIAYEYTGQYLDQVVAEGGGGGGLLGGVQKPYYNSYAAGDAQFSFNASYSYYLFYGHDQGKAIFGTGSRHEDGYDMTLFNLVNGGNSPRQIIVKNIGLPDEVEDPSTQQMVPYQQIHDTYEGPLTVEVRAGSNVKLNGVIGGKHRLYVPGETVTLLWDGEEWHIV